MSNNQYYPDYLRLDQIIQAQFPRSFEEGEVKAHDEMLFIIIHQAYELWFKQILFELDYVIDVFRQDQIHDNDESLNLCRHRLIRVGKILDLLSQQVKILDTMTPLDFLAFRDLLTPASGFQSLQFRLIEAKLGLNIQNRHQSDYYKRTNEGGFSKEHYEQLTNTETNQSLVKLMNRWLERMPFFEDRFWLPETAQNWWLSYKNIYWESLTEREQNKKSAFDYIFFNEVGQFSEEDKQILRRDWSDKAMQSALFIMLYRDFPLFQTAYQILDSVIEIDLKLSNWRHQHYIMVRRMIGMRVGTGNTSGAGYLDGAVNKHFVFTDAAALSTYLVKRSLLPSLPEALQKAISFQ